MYNNYIYIVYIISDINYALQTFSDVAVLTFTNNVYKGVRSREVNRGVLYFCLTHAQTDWSLMCAGGKKKSSMNGHNNLACMHCITAIIGSPLLCTRPAP